jgi:hypothetical protein
MIGILTRRRDRDTQESEWCQGRGRLELCLHKLRNTWDYQKPERPEKFSCRGFRRHMILPTPWVWTSSLQNCEAIHFCCFQPPNLRYFVALGNQNSRESSPTLGDASLLSSTQCTVDAQVRVFKYDRQSFLYTKDNRRVKSSRNQMESWEFTYSNDSSKMRPITIWSHNVTEF